MPLRSTAAPRGTTQTCPPSRPRPPTTHNLPGPVARVGIIVAAIAATGCPGTQPSDASDTLADSLRPDTASDVSPADVTGADADAADVTTADVADATNDTRTDALDAVDAPGDERDADDGTIDAPDIESSVEAEAGTDSGVDSDGSDTDAVVADDVSDVTADTARTCASNSDCGSLMYCAKDACDAALGRCEAMPDPGAPPSECGYLDPTTNPYVCGCDGRTYNNACAAHAHGVNVAFVGSCTCRVNADCPSTAFCFTQYCGGSGQCRRLGTVACLGLLACGCDGTTLRDCDLYAAGTNTAWVGHRCSIPPAAGEACHPLMTSPAPCAAGLRCIPLPSDLMRGICGI